jgi:rhamnosyltransferase
MENGSSHKSYTVSVIIPTLNGAETLPELLAALTIQSVLPDEILVIDSHSDDNSAEIAHSYGAKVTIIERTEFDHGGTRSMAAKRAIGDILVFFTQDVIPAHRRVLEYLVRPLIADDLIAICYGRQLPAFDADEFAAHLRGFNYPDISVVRSFSDRSVLGLETVFSSNSCAAYLKHHLAGINYFKSGLIFGEDTCAAGRMLEKGEKVAYVADASVFHSHNYAWLEDFSRYFDIGVFHADDPWLLNTFGTTGSRGKQYVRSGVSHLYNRGYYSLIGDFMVRVALKFLGYQLGRHYQKIPRKFLPKLSMNKNWWKTKNTS